MALAAVILIVIAGLIYVYVNLDDIVKTTIEQAGKRVTQAEVTVDSVKIEPTQNTASISKLKIGNPSGFDTDYAFSLGNISVQLDGSTLTSDTIRIIRVDVDAPSVIYELGNNSSNIATIQRNVQAFVKGVSGGASSGGTSGDSSSSSQSGTKVVIDDVYVRNGDVSISANILKGRKLTSSLPEIHLTDIGKSEGGATPAEVASKILTAINKAVFQSVAKLNVGGLLQGAGDLGLGVINNLGGATSGAGSILKDGASGLGSAVNGLLGGSSN